MSSRCFYAPNYTTYALFTADVLEYISQHVQRRWFSKEAGGELFSPAPNDDGLLISVACGPNSTDIRGRYYFNPDVNASMEARQFQAKQNLYPVGLWHTHPSSRPIPSVQDREVAMEYLKALEGDVIRYLMVTVGNSIRPVSISVWVATVHSWVQWYE